MPNDLTIHPFDTEAIRILEASGAFDAEWFAARNADLAGSTIDPLTHFQLWGWRENRWPNAYFEPDSYLRRYPDVRDADINPLLHYVRCGEAEGRRPVTYFDPVWYRRAHDVGREELCLTHFLRHRRTGTVSPLEAFDVRFYLDHAPDVCRAGIDPFEHYLVQGFKEDRRFSASHDPAACRRMVLGGRADHPLLHLIARPELDVPDLDVLPQGAPATDPGTNIPREVARFSRPGPGFEAVAPLPPGARPSATVLAFYLPQFHPVPENDSAWGTGFTEWTNTARALPRFVGHYQPRIPRDLGHYRLDDGTATLRRQWELASGAGLAGFIFYYYRFGLRRVLDGPVEALLSDKVLELPFALMWANENWTRRWDGSDDEVLIAQHHDPADEPALVDDLLRHMRDPRYIRVDGRPLLLVYRADLLPPGAPGRWRDLFRAAGEDPWLIMAQTFGHSDPRGFGMDAAVEFPPHKLGDALPNLRPGLVAAGQLLDPAMSTSVLSYDTLAETALAEPAPPFPLIRTVVPSWDNEARRPGRGSVYHGATPARYGAWLDGALRYAGRHPLGGSALVCVNAWNEWAEGAYLEPDQHWGAAFLNETGRALVRQPGKAADGRRRLLLIGHDAFPAGSQLLLLALGRHWAHVCGAAVTFVLLAGGDLLERFQAVATTLVPAPGELPGLLRGFRGSAALVHSAAAAAAGPELAACGIPFVLAVHEMPGLLRARGLAEPLHVAAGLARTVVFAASHVRDRVGEIVPLDPDRTRVLPQGVYATPRPGSEAPTIERTRLRIPAGAALVVGMGHADLRKGFDLFLGAWRILSSRPAASRSAPVHLVWVGSISPTVANDLGAEIAAAQASGTFHLAPFQPNAADWFATADVLLLTSREDPFPSVVLEAMAAGVPTVAFEEAGGVPDLLREAESGIAVPFVDVQAAARAVRRLLRGWTRADRARVAALAQDRFAFAPYAASMLQMLLPGEPDISVAVPSFDYARFLPDRLRSVWAQTAPVREVLLLDDASSDDSVAVAHAAAAAAARVLDVAVQPAPTGVWAQWRRAARRARGEWLWIAEADDDADPGLLQALHPALADDRLVLAFTDSQPMDERGAPAGDPYAGHYREVGLADLADGGVWDGAEFVARFLSQRNAILNASAVVLAQDRPVGGAGPVLDRPVAHAPGGRLAVVCRGADGAGRPGRLRAGGAQPASPP